MFQFWRLKLREAEQAYKRGQFDQAARVLLADELRQYHPAQQLAAQVASGLIQRCRQNAALGDIATAWRDLEAARTLGEQTEDWIVARRELLDYELMSLENQLRADDTTAAWKRLERLEQRRCPGESLGVWKQLVERIQSASNLCRHGKFAEAEVQLACAAALRPDLEMIQQRRQACQKHLLHSRDLTEQLHRAMTAADWSRALVVADELLELAPECRVARQARQKAWSQVGAVVSAARSPAHTCSAAAEVLVPPRGLGVPEETVAYRKETSVTTDEFTMATRQPGSRLLLWVDGVGGYLVCLANRVVLGQAVGEGVADVPILADLSRRHAMIRREGENYLIEPLGPVCVAGKPIQDVTLLTDGTEIELAGSVRMRFRKPHALSASARLDFISRHRTQPWVDGVLLMAESCVLGPKPHNHVVCRDWTDDVVLFRQGEDLCCRTMEAIEIDGSLCDGRGRLNGNSRIAGRDFSMCLEEI